MAAKLAVIAALCVRCGHWALALSIYALLTWRFISRSPFLISRVPELNTAFRNYKCNNYIKNQG